MLLAETLNIKFELLRFIRSPAVLTLSCRLQHFTSTTIHLPQNTRHSSTTTRTIQLPCDHKHPQQSVVDYLPATQKLQAMAATAVADLPELLEAILLRLPLTDILLAQRVSRTWRDIIAGSPSLQRALFFRLTTSLLLAHDRQMTPWQVGTCAHRFECNSKAAKGPVHDPPLSSRYAALTPRPWGNEMRSASGASFLVNPFMRSKFQWLDFCDSSTSATEIDIMEDNYLRKDATWRKMLLSQPPLAMVMFDEHLDKDHYHQWPAQGPGDALTLQDMEEAAVCFSGRVTIDSVAQEIHGLELQPAQPLTGQDVLRLGTGRVLGGKDRLGAVADVELTGTSSQQTDS